VRQVYETLLDMESSQRGYLLTGDPGYLDPYLRDAASIEKTVATFERLYQNDPQNAAIVADILHLVRDKQAELAETIALARGGHRDAAMKIVNENRGKTLMDALRTKLLAVIAQQRSVRTSYVDEGRATLRHLYMLGAAVGVLMLMLVIIAVRSLTTSIT